MSILIALVIILAATVWAHRLDQEQQ